MRRFSRSFLSRRQSRLETIRDETIRVLPRASPHPEHSSRWIFSYLPVSLTSLSLDIRSSPATANRHWIKQLPLTKTSAPVCAPSHSMSPFCFFLGPSNLPRMQDKLASHSQKVQGITKSTSCQCDGGFPCLSSGNRSLGSRAPGANKVPLLLTAFDSYFAHPALLLPSQRPDPARQKCCRKLAVFWDHAQEKQKVSKDPHLIDPSCMWRQESAPLLQYLIGSVLKKCQP